MEYSDLSLMDKFIFSRWTYSIGEPVITNDEYTRLLRAFKENYPDSPYSTQSWSDDPCPTELLNRMGRTDLIRQIILGDKTESIPSLNSEAEVQDTLQEAGYGTMSMKHDGWNIQANYFNGKLVNIQTRGRTRDSVDVTQLADRVPKTVPFSGPVKVVQELTISKENFKTCVKLFGNASPRSAVSTVLARKEHYDLLSMHAFDIHGVALGNKCKFEVLRDIGFDTPMWTFVYGYQDILHALKQLSDAEPSYQFPTDGAVYDGTSRYAIRLLAWEEPIYKSYVTGYLEQWNLYRISPSVYIKPILRKGTTQRRVNMTNWQRILDYNLQLGAPVAFRVASSSIADFDEEATRLLHVEFGGRWDVYKEQIDRAEEISRCMQRTMYL